jgi:hypothetical protein
MVKETPEWEAELWFYINSGNGKECPLISQCQVKNKDGICLDDLKTQISSLFVSDIFSRDNYDATLCRKCGRIYELVNKLALQYLQISGTDHPPVPSHLISLIDNSNPIEVRPVPLKKYSGAVWKMSNSWVIHLNTNETREMQRFTLFHEAFHILAHSNGTPVFNKMAGTEGTFNEIMADCFSACILIPEDWARNIWPEVKDVKRMAEIFEVPRQTMYIQLKWMGLL